MDSDTVNAITSLFPEHRKLNQHVRYIERSSAELNTDLEVIRDPTTFERFYNLGAQIGKGGFGKVHEAVHTGTGKSVIIKQVDSDRVPCWCRFDGVMVPMEVLLLKMLSKVEGVSRMLEVYDLNGTWHIVMTGNAPNVLDLFDYICKRGYLNEGESAFITYQLIGILLQCHASGVIHRDLKDENILIDPENFQIRLIDFGSGSFLHDGVYTDFDGTRVYSPPEWIQTGEYLGKAAEVWTVGILLFDMINGDIPFNSDAEIRAGVVRFRRAVHPEARDLIHICLRQNPTERPTLMQILQHPWMKMFRNSIAKVDCPASKYALAVSADLIPSPLTTSVTVRSGLCNLANLSIANDGHKHLNKIKESCEVSPDLLPVQSAESVSASCNHIGHICGDLLGHQLILTIPDSSSSSGDHNSRSVFRAASVNLNPAALDVLLPNSDEVDLFRRQQVQGKQLQLSLARDFQLSENSPSPNSSGYISRSSSIEEQNRGNTTSNMASRQQSNPKLIRGESIDISLSSSDHVHDPTPTSDSTNPTHIPNSSFFKWDGKAALMISLASNSILKSNLPPPGFGEAGLFHIQSSGPKMTRS